jgi:murein L,D-transpeptidase YafK
MRPILVVLVLSLSAVRAHTVEKVDRIIVHKKDHTMELMRAGKVIKTYKIALGRNPVGPKQREGDFRTPEGVYVIDSRNAKSQCHRSLHISYPNAADRERARKRGVSAMATSAQRIAGGTGRTAVLPLPMKKLMRSGTWWTTAHQ